MSKMILMEDYHNLRFGYCENFSESDFIDNINGKLNIHIAKGYDGESEFMFTYTGGDWKRDKEIKESIVNNENKSSRVIGV